MKNLIQIQDTADNKISFGLIAAFIITLPFDRLYSELALICLFLHCLIHLRKDKLRSLAKVENLTLSSIFLLTVIGIAWSPDKGQAMKDVQRQLAILLIPIILSLTNLDLYQYKNKILTFLVVTCTATVIYLYVDAFRIIAYNKLPAKQILSPFFLNHNFSAPVGIHATYLSMYISLAIAWLLVVLTSEKKRSLRSLQIVILMLLIAGLLQLASRAVLFTTIAYVVIVFPLLFPPPFARTKFIVVSLSLSLLAIVAITQIDSYRNRYVVALQEDLTQTPVNNELLEPRIIRWKIALELFKKSPVIGYGSGTEKRILKERYFEKKLFNSYIQELNSHNQYLSLLLKTGILGLAIFIFSLFRGFSAAWSKKDTVFICFLLLIATVSFSENILDVNKGIFFYAFFFSFFLKTSKPFTHFTRFND